MSNSVPNSHHLREVLLHCFISKKTAAESHRIFVKVYGEHALSETTYRDWFQRFKSGDFDLSNKDRGKPMKKFWYRIAGIAGQRFNSNPKTIGKSIGSWLGNYFQTLTCDWKDRKEGKWVPYVSKEKDIERRKITCEILLDRFKRKSFLHCIVTGDEKWIFFDNPKHKKSWVDLGRPSTSQPVCNIHGKKALLCTSYQKDGKKS